jgi:cytochrome c peroxidase
MSKGFSGIFDSAIHRTTAGNGDAKTWRCIAAVTLLVLTCSNQLAAEAAAVTQFSNAEIKQLQRFGPWPYPVPADPGNELSGLEWAEALGRKLFSDRILSGDQTIACASCHQSDKGFADGLPTARGHQQHVRNTQGLFNVAYQHWFGWDGGSDSLWAASLRPMLSDIEMSADIDTVAARLRSTPYVISALTSNGLPADHRTNEALLVLAAKALGAFQRTLVSPKTAFDHFVEALITADISAQRQYPEDAKRGIKLFFGEGNCHVCHFGPHFSNGEFHDTGRPFFTAVGQVDPGRYNGITRVRSDPYNLTGVYNRTQVPAQIQKTRRVKQGQVNFGQWRTPGLRGLRHTAPYMHDGSLATLREVVDSYADTDPARLHTEGESLVRPLDWTTQQREDVVAFLQSLSDTSRNSSVD